ncbi:phage tail protein I [Xanthobacter sp. VTT E-85241]|uniref:phage tail protein I n=1 Tax=Roseixanthobacter finlandensis TaxID=3119922 RepID=UPI0037284828
MARVPVTSLIPPPLSGDARVRALLQVFGELLDEMEDWALILLDPATVPDVVLPALTYEHSLDEFVGAEGLPVLVIRDMIARAWDLHEPKGYAEGVEGGVAMLGYPATLVQWWQEAPQAIRGTHRIEVRTDQPLWPGQPPAGPGTVRAIWRMVRAMQRWSQDHAVQLISEASVATKVGVGVLAAVRMQIEPFDPGIQEVSTGVQAGVGIVTGHLIIVSGWMD